MRATESSPATPAATLYPSMPSATAVASSPAAGLPWTLGGGEPGGERRVAHAVGHGLRSAGRGERLHWPLRRPNVRWGGVGGGHEGGGRQGQQQDADRGGQPTAGDEDEKQAGEPVSSGAKVQAERKDDPLEHVRSYASTEDAVKRLSGQSGPEGHGCRQ